MDGTYSYSERPISGNLSLRMLFLKYYSFIQRPKELNTELAESVNIVQFYNQLIYHSYTNVCSKCS